MNLPLTIPNKRFLHLAIAAVLIASATAAKAQIQLSIIDSDSTAVIITATGYDASGAGTSTLDQGIDLANFLSNNLIFTQDNPIATSSLTTGNGSAGGLTFNEWATDEYSNLSYDNDLNLYGASAPETFATNAAAFQGTLVLNLSSFAGDLPGIGDTGSIVTGYHTAPDGNSPVGTWQVVPEPSAWKLLVLGFALIPLARLRSSRR